jgi:hypothetical protein
MAEPLFFDCLTDAQLWSLLDSEVLHAYTLPEEAYERLAHLAAAHGCYLFTWPADTALPPLQDIAPSLAVSPTQPSERLERNEPQRRPAPERVRGEIERFCARVHTGMPTESGRIHVITTSPAVGFRTGPYLEPPPRDLAAMSLPELEAYLEAILRVEDRNNDDTPG